MFNKDFYPTPSSLAIKMIAKIKGSPRKILEPSAGKGDIVDALENRYNYNSIDISTIEFDKELRATLRGKKIKVIDTDFLSYAGPDKYDLIIANPPFDGGDKHLLKAIDVIYRGQIIFLLNAETLKNPHSNIRKDLARKLKELNAEIEYIQNAFKDAERPTGVEIALVNIVIDRKIEEDLFKGVDDTAEIRTPDIEHKHELSTGKKVEELVAEYNQIIHLGTETIIDYYRNYRKIGKYIGLNAEVSKYSGGKDMTDLMQDQLNSMIGCVRVDFWRKTLDLQEVRGRLTSKKQDEFEHNLKERSDMDFTENNIRAFVLNLIGGYEKTILDSILDVFDRFTIRHSWSDDNRHEKNIHYFNGWKTNKAFKVGKRVIIPIHTRYGSSFSNYSGKLDIDYDVARQLRDIDLVMNYFDGMENYISMSNAIKEAFEQGQTTKIKSTYFSMNCYMKGTIHLTFNDMDILRRFNVMACKGKEWLPGDYGAKGYTELTHAEKDVADTFEGEKLYTKNLGQTLLQQSKLLQITL